MDHLNIDLSRCVGCTACAGVCIRKHIAIEVGHPTEVESELSCMDCGHCAAICPKGAISLTRYPDFVPEEYDPKDVPVDAGSLTEMLSHRRSVRWFTTDRVTEEEFDAMLSAASNIPTVENSQDVEFAIVDGGFGRFMRHLAGILEARKDELPRARQLVEYVNDPFPMGPNPLTWEGRQMILAFATHLEDAYIAMARVELMAQAMGLGCFYSHWVQVADATDHGRFMEFFEGIPAEKSLGCVLVVGHPRVRYRRTVPRDPVKVTRCRSWSTTAR